MESSKIDDGVLRRIKKCLALGTDPRTPPAEAEAAMRQAQKMMALYGVEKGALVASEVGRTMFKSVRAVRPAHWEYLLVSELSRAFGCRILFCEGWGPKGAKSKAHWMIVGLKHQLELINYAVDVVRRQLLKARAEFVSDLPFYQTRPEKAAHADTFCEGYVAAMRRQIHDFALTDEQREAIEAKAKSLVDPERKPLTTDSGSGSALAAVAGASAGAKANLHRPMNGGAESIKIGV